MHTIDDQPATYDGAQLVRVLTPHGAVRLARSLRQIKRERGAARAWRRRTGLPPLTARYGHVRVVV